MKILVVKLSSLGDLFHALPAVRNLKIGLNAEIHWITQKEYVDVVKCFTPVDHVIPFHRKAFFRNSARLLQELRSTEYDYVIDLQGLLKSAVIARLARGRTRIGPSFSREGARLFYTAVAGPRNKNRHAVDENMDVIRFLGLEVLKPEFPVNVSRKDLSGKRPRVAILPVSRWRTKTWPAERFSEVAAQLRIKANASIFLLGGPDEKATCESINDALGGNAINLAGNNTSLVDTLAVLKEMDLLIANDSGPVHMAAAVGTPSVVIFGPTDPVRTGPYGDKHRIVTTKLACQPCFSRRCRYDSVRCLEGVDSGKVFEAAMDILRGR